MKTSAAENSSPADNIYKHCNAHTFRGRGGRFLIIFYITFY